MTILFEEAKASTLRMIEPLLKELSAPCLENCTIDLINALHTLYLISDDSSERVEAEWPGLSPQAKLGLWALLQSRGGLNVEEKRYPRVVLAVLQVQLAVLLAHKAVCAQMNRDVDPAQKPVADLLQFPKNGKR